MRNCDVKRADPANSVDPVVFASMHDRSAHAELVSVCERLAQIWTQRRQIEADLLIRLQSDLAWTSGTAEALRVYSENASQRMRIALENAQRLFDEQLRIAARFSSCRD